MTRKPFRLLVLGGIWPHCHGNEQAAEVVTYEILKHLALDSDFQILYGCISLSPPNMTASARQGLDELTKLGIDFFPEPLLVTSIPRHKNHWSQFKRVLQATPKQWIPGSDQYQLILNSLNGRKIDGVLTIWSELATAVASGLPFPKFTYYGNPDHKTEQARIGFQREIESTFPMKAPAGKSMGSLLLHDLKIWALKRAHLKVMSSQAWIGDVAQNDADFYKKYGLPSEYIQNMWPGAIHPKIMEERALREKPNQLLKIIGNVGFLGATGNTLGLYTLVRDVLPVFKKVLGEGSFSIHLFGGGSPHPALLPSLKDPHIQLRGFVEDLDSEILSAPIFLISNNHRSFKVGHTRFLHAWSLGSCVIAFKDSALAMPEIVHKKNALLADSPEELAYLVSQARNDVDLRRKLGLGGLKTLENHFSPSRVVSILAQRLKITHSLES